MLLRRAGLSARVRLDRERSPAAFAGHRRRIRRRGSARVFHWDGSGLSDDAEGPFRGHRRPAAPDNVLSAFVCLTPTVQGEPQYPHFTGLLATSYTDAGGNLKTSLKLEPRYEHAGELMNRIVALDADPRACAVQSGARGSTRGFNNGQESRAGRKPRRDGVRANGLGGSANPARPP